jgi:ABC-type Zn uptake system ZnuABC Zn-binding protein ZnuA
MIRTRRSVAAVVGLAALAGLFALLPAGCGGGRDEVWPDRPGPKVVVTFAPIYCFAAKVAGDDAVVQNLMTTSGPHDFNPTDTEARLLRKANLLFINGLELDTNLANTLKRGSGNRDLKIVDLGGRIPQAELLEGACHHDHGPGEAHDHEHGTDPHIWLSPEFAVRMTETIRDELKAADPEHATNYDRRAAEYVGELRKLHADGLALLKDKKDRRLVTFHESLAYFAKSFNLDVADVVQKKPGVEPNSDELKKLIEICQAKKVRLIAVEPQYGTQTSAKTILEELKRKGVSDADLVAIDPLETVPAAELTPDWYVQKMRSNLEALARAMK